MKTLKRNESTVWYCTYNRTESMYDSNGYSTGEKRVVYNNPVAVKCNVHPATGTSQVEQFGNLDGYDRVIVMCNMGLPIDENTVFFIDSTPVTGDGAKGYDYAVRRISKSLNSISIAVTKVTKS